MHGRASGPRPRRRRGRPARRGRERPSCGAAAPSSCASASSTRTARRCATSTSSTTKRMHLIVVRRDLTGFQHLHPEHGGRRHLVGRRCASTTPAPTACSPTSRATASRTRSRADLRVDGAADLRAAARAATDRGSDGGYDVRLDDGAARAGEEADAALHGHPRRRAGRDRALPRRRRPPGRAARGRPRVPARAPRRTTTVALRGDVPDRGPLPPVPAVQGRRPRPHRRVHAGGDVAMSARRAADHRHDVRVVREPRSSAS